MSVNPSVPDLQFCTVANDGICNSLSEIVKRWESVRKGQDPEAVHDMRVATRRLRASLSVFQPIFPERQFERFERKISYLTDVLGDVRDTDVFIKFLLDEIDGLAPDRASEEFGLKEYLKHLKKLREQQQEILIKTLKRLDPAELMHDGDVLLDSLQPKREQRVKLKIG
jgi:CHAD domain-containing protein